MTDLELAYQALTYKKIAYDTLFAYYSGFQPLVYSRERLREIFHEINARFTQNWCAVVVDSTMERIQLREFTVADDEAAQDELNRIATLNELALEADCVHLSALVTGEAFVIAWPDEYDNTPQAYYNDPRMCHVFYEADNPREIRCAVKWWQDDNGYSYLNLYYTDRIEYYVSKRKVKSIGEISSAKSFIPAEIPVAANEYGVIPVFHFRRDRRAICSELANVIEPQDAINKLLNDMMIAAEFGAFRQRWIITEAGTTKLKNAPNEIWKIPPGVVDEQPTQVGEFSVTDLANYIQGIDKFSNAIAIITRTPKHYFFGQNGDPSGEALIAMEAPLNKKCQKYIDRFSATWRQVARFLLQLQGFEVDPLDISATFDKPETVQPYTEALTRKTNIEAGLPLTTALRDDGWTEAEIVSMQEDKTTEQQAAQQAAGFNPNEMAATVQAAQRVLQSGGN